MKFWIFAILLPGLYAFTDSVLEGQQAAKKDGKVFIKSMSEDGDRVRVSILPVASSDNLDHREFFELCSNLYHNPSDDGAVAAPKNILRQALEEGKYVRLHYQGRFSKCIAEVEALQTEI